MDANLIIDDSYVYSVGRRASVRGRKLDDILDEYITILDEIQKEAITSGKISKSLEEYRASVSMMKQHLNSISDSVETATDSFITAVNTADSYLF